MCISGACVLACVYQALLVQQLDYRRLAADMDLLLLRVFQWNMCINTCVHQLVFGMGHTPSFRLFSRAC